MFVVGKSKSAGLLRKSYALGSIVVFKNVHYLFLILSCPIARLCGLRSFFTPFLAADRSFPKCN